MTEKNQTDVTSSGEGWGQGKLAFVLVLVPLLMSFSLSQFYRSAQALLADSLRIELGVTPEELGFISGSFHFAFALMQIPVGVMLDRYGPRKTNGIMMIMTVLGVVVFASAHSVTGLMIGQGIIGMGCAAAFMATLVCASRWVAPEKFAATSGIIVALSLLGVLASATPLAALIEYQGWRGVYFWLAGLSLLSVVLTFVMVRDDPPHMRRKQARRGESMREVLQGIMEVWRNRQMWLLVAVGFFAYPTILTVRGLWGGPYLQDVFHLSPVEVGNILLGMTIGMIFGPPCYGHVSRVMGGRARPLILFSVFVSTALLICQALFGAGHVWLAAVLMMAHGFLGSCATLNYAASRAAVPPHLVGRALTTVNLATFGGLFVLQGLAGMIIGHYPADAATLGYQWMFAFLGIGLGVAGLAFMVGGRGRKAPKNG
ncbi:MFS transporter [Thalassospira profundimaris]|uniref:Lysosomal dipeptide transporter MFSD1 n=1 Tax=Thalassospira profundimaris TaxID=502049 RepID=A0A367X4Y1_9PROT|nr:MFS transporter [Thalassospira profundimaris]RCK48724.1 MFS transporter [Thalassospira profundimaris]